MSITGEACLLAALGESNRTITASGLVATDRLTGKNGETQKHGKERIASSIHLHRSRVGRALMPFISMLMFNGSCSPPTRTGWLPLFLTYPQLPFNLSRSLAELAIIRPFNLSPEIPSITSSCNGGIRRVELLAWGYVVVQGISS